MSILTVEKPDASKMSPGETLGPFLKSLYQRNIILFCNYYGALLEKMFFSLYQSKKKFVYSGEKTTKNVYSSEQKRLLCGEKL